MCFKISRPLSLKILRYIQRTILSWGKVNFRDYPWRKDCATPYEVLLSEYLLRKTRADSVIPVYRELLKKYPEIVDLSKANQKTLERILRPVGLYRVRAKALKDMSSIIVKDHKGKIPHDEKSIARLPHSGRYITNSFLCFCFNDDRPIVDTSVQRFLCRHFGFEPVVEIHKADHMWEFMKKLLPRGRSREFNYSLLDYCSIICTSKECLCSKVFKNI